LKILLIIFSEGNTKFKYLSFLTGRKPGTPAEVDTGNLTPEQVADKILEYLN
jgi:hypothetical protein